MKKGFTLIELLLVIVIVAATSLAAAIVFSNVNKSTSEQDLQNTYVAIQRAAKTYVDLNDSFNAVLLEQNYVNVSLSELKKTNYLTYNIVDPINKFGLSGYSVRVCVTKSSLQTIDGEKIEIGKTINTCIYNTSNACIANSYGESDSDSWRDRPCCDGC